MLVVIPPVFTPGWREALRKKSVLPKDIRQRPRSGLETRLSSIHRANIPSQGTYPSPSFTVGICVCCKVPLESKTPPSRETRISTRVTGLSSRETKHSSRETRALSLRVELWFRSLYGDFFYFFLYLRFQSSTVWSFSSTA